MEMGFDGKSSLSYYGLDLQYCYITTPKRKRSLVDVLAADGMIDAMKGFEPTYENRTVTAEFKVIAGSMEDARNRLINELEGRTVKIILPDNPNYYMLGDIHISGAGCRPGSQVMITADCIPWRYSRIETVYHAAASAANVNHTLRNAGTRLAVPEITVDDDDVIITVNNEEKTLVAGVHLLPDLAIPGDGILVVTARGGSFTARYREAIL